MMTDKLAEAGFRRPAIYARTAMPHQRRIPNKVEFCRQECERRGVKPQYILRDEGVSAKTEERIAYQRLLDLIALRNIDAVVRRVRSFLRS